ncbi:ParB N-terminal domain-containing protein [Candidatus Bathycorpusculum sp.]|uniref:ParB/RepB/Spo0J family partition protein n=1 Tax=Candidatus Bathycorpusculum sp. TaxID=2994959 RepID=UPI00283695AD|nr:ParB N-terminal domain-containing protein [Candidatus Termitimicrobium sp.]MCL2432176.1 ParB N-terminal domain-containing protein [Candidatus Termitimicrobium sp.]
MLKLKLNQIKANPWNCNFLGTQEKHKLKQRMEQDGPEKTPPLMVRKITQNNYELVDGEQRWTIANELGWETINAIEHKVNDIQTRALCISYNRWRGRLNWFKLYDIIKKDQDQGIDLKEAYQNALSNKEIEWLLSLENLTTQTRPILEEAIKQHPEITLEQLHLLSLFPTAQQQDLVAKFKKPIVAQALLQALNPLLPKAQASPAQPPFYSKQAIPYHLLEKTKDQNINNTSEKTADPSSKQTGDRSETHIEQKEPKTSPFEPQSWKPQQDKTQPTPPNLTETTETDIEQTAHREEERHQAWLVEVSYNCDCNRHYRVNFKNMSVVVQKQNLLFEHADLKPHTFQVHCKKCNSDHAFAVEGTEYETKQIFCRRCRPPREGILDANTGEAIWFI